MFIYQLVICYRYEEEYMTRLPTSKKDRHRGRHSMAIGNIGDQLTYFEDIKVLEDEGALTKSGKRGRKSVGKSVNKKGIFIVKYIFIQFLDLVHYIFCSISLLPLLIKSSTLLTVVHLFFQHYNLTLLFELSLIYQLVIRV